MRTKDMESNVPALWSHLKPLVECVKIPVIANGDVYTHEDIHNVRTISGCSGVMLSRALLLNASLIRPVADGGCHALRDTICDFLNLCVTYKPPFQVLRLYIVSHTAIHTITSPIWWH
jgi:tRNA-dihydrouridine synthase